MASLPLWCDVCSLQFSGPVPAQQHYQSVKHKKKLENSTHLAESGTYCQICNIHCDTVQILRQHESSPRHLALVEKHKQLSDTATPPAETTNHYVGQVNDMDTVTDHGDKEYVFNGSRGHCYLCNIDLTSESHAKSHIYGKNHIKKKSQKEYREEHSKRSQSSYNLLEDDDMPQDLFCKACQVPFSSSISAREHFISDKHKKKVRSLQIERGIAMEEGKITGKYSCKFCGVSFDDVESATEHYNSESHKRFTALLESGITVRMEPLPSRLTCKICNVSFNSSGDYTKHYDSQNHMEKAALIYQQEETTREMPKDQQLMKCEVCHVVFSGPESAGQHYASDKHKKKLLLYNTEGNTELLSCDICNVHFSSADNKRDHMASYKHKKYVELKEKEKSGNLLPLFCNICTCQFTGQENAEAHFKSKKHKRNQENVEIQQKCTSTQSKTNLQMKKDEEMHKTLPENTTAEFTLEKMVFDESQHSVCVIGSSNEQHCAMEVDSPFKNKPEQNIAENTSREYYQNDKDVFHTKPLRKFEFDREMRRSESYEENFIAKPVSIDNDSFQRRHVSDHDEKVGTKHLLSGDKEFELYEQIARSGIEQPGMTDENTRLLHNLYDDNIKVEPSDERKIEEETQTRHRPTLGEILMSDLSYQSELNPSVFDSGTVHDEQPVQFIKNNLQPLPVGRGRGLFKISNLLTEQKPGFHPRIPTNCKQETSNRSQNVPSLVDKNEDDDTKFERFMSKISKKENVKDDTNENGQEIGTQRPGMYGQYQVLQYSTKSKKLEDHPEFKHAGTNENMLLQHGNDSNRNNQGNHFVDFDFSAEKTNYEWNATKMNYTHYSGSEMTFKTAGNGYERRLSTDSNISGTLSEGFIKGTNSEGSVEGSVDQDEYRFSKTTERGWCYVCSIELTSRNHMKQHVLGRKHLKAKEIWKMGALKDVLGSIYRCDVCNMTFSGPEPEKQHLESQSHKNKVRQIETGGQDFFCSICKVQCSGESSYVQHLAGAQHLKMSGGSSSSSAYLDKTKWYDCDTCKCRLNTRQQLEIHKKSPRHLAKLQRYQNFDTNDEDFRATQNAYTSESTNPCKNVLVSINDSQSGQQSMLEKFLSEPLFPDEFVSDDSGEYSQGKPRIMEPLVITDEPVPVMKRFAVPTTPELYAEDEAIGSASGNPKRGQRSDLAWATRSTGSGVNARNDKGLSAGSSPKVETNEHSDNINPYADTHHYYCGTCRVPMNTQESYEAHIKGTRHMTKVCNEKAPDRVHMARLNHSAGEIPKTKLVPRSYQIELYKKTVDMDTLCFLPTGTGKTLVSVLTLWHVLDEFPSKNVLFLVDKVLLVLQQSKYIKDQIAGKLFIRYDPESDGYQELVRRPLNIAAVCMGQQSTSGLPMWKHDVVIVTAAFCQNLLDRGILKWTDFSLVIIDEAHHCERSHPFNTLMQQYHSQVRYKKDVPKILGLTASPAGKADLPKTIIMLENLLTNMGHAFMNIVEEEKNLEILHALQSNAEMIVKVQPRTEETDQIENFKLIKRQLLVYTIDCLKLLNRVSNISYYIDLDWIKSDAEVIIFIEFEQKIDAVQSCLGMISSDTMEKVQFSLFTQHLQSLCMAYSSLLEGGVLCAIEELSDMEGTHANFKFAKSIGLPCDELYKAVMNQGQCMLSGSETGSDMTRKTGSHIQSLIRELIVASEGNQSTDSNAISLVLVKERGTAHKLCTVLNSSVEMKRRGLKTVSVVGHGGSGAGDKGMSVNQQKRVLEEIKQQMYRVVIATSVAEEGVDWPECNCVISLYPPSTVTALVQMRGRARKKDSKFVILCDNETEKEKLEEILRREQLMIEATRVISMKQKQNQIYPYMQFD